MGNTSPMGKNTRNCSVYYRKFLSRVSVPVLFLHQLFPTFDPWLERVKLAFAKPMKGMERLG
jgi:hypothetical protein